MRETNHNMKTPPKKYAKDRRAVAVICNNPRSYCLSKRPIAAKQGQHRCLCSFLTFDSGTPEGAALKHQRKLKKGGASAGNANPRARKLEKAWGDAVGAVGVGR